MRPPPARSQTNLDHTGYPGKDFVPRPRTAGFTILEMLVAAAILAVMASLLLPTVSKLSLRGKEASSISNLRGIGQGIASYAGEHGGFLPPAYVSNSQAPFWGEEVSAYLGEVASTNQFRNAQARPYRVNAGILDPMVKNGLHCRLGDYGANVDVLRPLHDIPTGGSTQGPLSLAAVTNPSRVISVMASEQTLTGTDPIASWALSTFIYVSQGAGMSKAQSSPSDRGTGRVAALFVDGHVELIQKKQLEQDRRNYLLVNP